MSSTIVEVYGNCRNTTDNVMEYYSYAFLLFSPDN